MARVKPAAGRQRYEVIMPTTLLAKCRREAERRGLTTSGYIRQAIGLAVEADERKCRDQAR